MELENRRILIAEDDRNTARVIRHLLIVFTDVMDHNVFSAENGEEAAAILVKNHIDLVISDNQMPKMTGIELLRWMRKHKINRIKKAGFILLTGDDGKDLKQEAQLSGAYYLVKPVMLLELRKLIFEILKNSPGG